MEEQFLVGVVCMTYNQSAFIGDAMNGFTMQQTNFPYVCCIIDDSSIDGEPEIIRHYLEDYFDLSDKSVVRHEETDDYVLCYAKHKTNRNCFFAVLWLKYNHYGKKRKDPYNDRFLKDVKYVALCEGDDYWTDEKKIQKQVDFLERNQDYTMCFHNAIEHYEYGNKKDRIFSNIKNRDYTGIEIFRNWIVPTASVIIRKEVFESELYKQVVSNKVFIYRDTPLFVTCVSLGRIRGMHEVMSVYRRNQGSLTHQNSYEKRKMSACHCLEFYKVFGEKYRKCSKTLCCRAMMKGFLISLFDKESPIRYDFMRESLSISITLTIPALLWAVKKGLYKMIKYISR